MSNNGLAAAPQKTTSAPKKMFKKVSRRDDDEVARGHARVTEIIAYDFDRMEKVIDGLTGQPTGKERAVEKSRGPYFCQTKEQEQIFKVNNPDARIETFGIQLLESTAEEKMNKPENIEQFTKQEVDND